MEVETVMFCPSCGAEASEGLSYCKRCGARLGAARGDDARPRVAGLVWAVSTALVLITLVGFAVILGFIVEFGRDASNLVIGLLGLLLLVVLAVDYLLARQLSRLVSYHLHGRDDDAARAEQLRPAARPPAQLEAPRQPIGHFEPTTRTLGEIEQPTRALGDAEQQATRTLDPTPGEREPR